MKAIELYKKEVDGVAPTGIFYCGNCKVVHRTKDLADGCCLCSGCKEKPCAKNSHLCMECRTVWQAEMNEKQRQKEAKVLDDAELVIDAGPVWYNDHYYSDVGDLEESLECDGSELPEFVHLMKPVKFTKFSPEELFDNYNENIMCEDLDIRDKLCGMASLKKAFDEFNEDNEGTTIFWEEDSTKKVKV